MNLVNSMFAEWVKKMENNIPHIKTEIREIPSGKAGTKETIKRMIHYAITGSSDPRIISLARNIVRKLNTRDNFETSAKIFEWVKANVDFVRDPTFFEAVQTPINTLIFRQGDCDDQSTLLACLNLAIGNEARFITTGHERKDRYSHVYIQVLNRKDKKWIGYDSVVKKSYPGWEGTNYVIKTAWYITPSKEMMKNHVQSVNERNAQEQREESRLVNELKVNTPESKILDDKKNICRGMGENTALQRKKSNDFKFKEYTWDNTKTGFENFVRFMEINGVANNLPKKPINDLAKEYAAFDKKVGLNSHTQPESKILTTEDKEFFNVFDKPQDGVDLIKQECPLISSCEFDQELRADNDFVTNANELETILRLKGM